MRKLILYTSIIFVFLGIAQIDAQTKLSEKNNYAVLIKNMQQLAPVILTAQDLIKEDGPKMGEFKVVICGKTVKEIKGMLLLKAYCSKPII